MSQEEKMDGHRLKNLLITLNQIIQIYLQLQMQNELI